MFAHGEPVEVITPGVRSDTYGNTVVSWDDATTVTVQGAAFAPEGGTEDNEGRTAVISTPRLFLPAGTVIDSASRVRVRGQLFEAVGDSAEWVNPFTGWNAGVSLNMKRVEG